MAMRLVTQQGQRLVMTPLLQQAVQLLQLSTLELEQVVRKKLEENPLLEELPEEKAFASGTLADEVYVLDDVSGKRLAMSPAVLRAKDTKE